MRHKLSLLLAIGLISWGCQNQPVEEPQAEVKDSAEISRQTEATLTHHLESFGKGDLDGLLSDYTEESKILTPDGALEGTAGIKPFFEKLGAMFPPGSKFEMIKQIIDGEIAYIVWTLESEQVKVILGTDTFVIRDGKILTQTFAVHTEAKE